MILGIDEVGRGPWAGPLVVGAVALEDPTDDIWQKLNDSKKLTAKRREEQSVIILQQAELTGLGWVPANELDQIGLANALKLATMRAICKALSLETPNNTEEFNNIIGKNSDLPFTEIIVDGTINFLKGTVLENVTSILPKADSKIKAVSAASIIAKVTRDNYMKNLAEKYPEYGFEKHVGYGTKLHKEALEKLGPCPEHRRSVKPVAILLREQGATATRELPQHFIKKRSGRLSTTSIGKKAETLVAEYLKSQGHTILAKNYKTKFYEIDIISATKDHIYFTEVKYRRNSKHGEPLEFIDQKKQTQMDFAARAYMNLLSKKLGRKQSDLPSPILAVASVSDKDYNLDDWFTIS